MKPLSSRNAITASLRRAPFLFVATPSCANAVPLPCLLPELAVRASGKSNQGSSTDTTHGLDDSGPQIPVRSPGRRADKSTGRWNTPPLQAHRGESLPAASSAGHSTVVSRRSVSWPSTPGILPSRKPFSNATPKKKLFARTELLDARPGLAETSGPPTDGGPPFVRASSSVLLSCTIIYTTYLPLHYQHGLQ